MRLLLTAALIAALVVTPVLIGTWRANRKARLHDQRMRGPRW